MVSRRKHRCLPLYTYRRTGASENYGPLTTATVMVLL